MSTPRPISAPLPDESRLVLADAAAAAERANQPRYVVVLALGLAAVAGVLALLAWSQRAQAAGRLEQERAATAATLRAVAQLQAARSAQAELESERYTSNAFIAGRIETAAREAGLVNVTITESDDSRTSSTSFRRRKYTAALSPQNAEALFSWIARSLEQVPGLELSLIELQPGMATVEGNPRWQGSISFTRWERRN